MYYLYLLTINNFQFIILFQHQKKEKHLFFETTILVIKDLCK